MSPSAKINSLIAENFTIFTFKGIETNINSRGEEKKKPIGMPVWKQINQDNFRNYIDMKNDTATAIITGKMSGITVIDFDDVNEYNKLVADYPDIKKHRTIKTKNGYHIYCQYTDKLSSTTNGLKSYNKVDIRNDDSIIFAPPTTYVLNDKSIAIYEDIGGELLPVPEIILKDAKYNQEPQKIIKVITQKIEDPINDLNNIRKAIKEGKLDFKVKSEKGYDDWRDVGFIIKNTSQCELAREIFHEFSQRNPDKYDEKYTNDFWNTIKQPKDKKPLTIATLYSWIKPPKIANTDLEAANILFLELKDVLVSVKRRVFYYNNNIWICDDSVEDELLGYVMKSNIKSKGAKEGSFLPFVEDYSQAKNVLKTLLIKIKNDNNDPDLYRKFHSTTKGKLCFNDGVLDFKKKCFTKWENVPRFTIYSTVKINRDFGNILENPPLEAMNNLQKQLFSAKYGTKESTFYHFLSRAISGHNEDKRWATYLGNRNCGKGVEYDLLKAAFGDYISTFELGNLLYCRKTAGMENVDCSKKLYWLMDLEFVRLAVSQEIPDAKSGMVINGKMLKKITGGGDEIVARRNYDRFDTHFFTDFTPYLQGNYSVSCDSPDCEETLIDFASTVEYVKREVYDSKSNTEKEIRYRVADPTIKQKCLTDEWINAMIYLVFINYNDVSVPIDRDFNSDAIDLPQILEETFEITLKQDDVMLCADVCTALPDYDKRKIEMELALKNVHKRKYKKSGPFRDKWVFFGMKNRIVDDEEE